MDSMLEKLSMLERMEKMMQKWESSERFSTSEEKKVISPNPTDPHLGVMAAPLEESSMGIDYRVRPWKISGFPIPIIA